MNKMRLFLIVAVVAAGADRAWADTIPGSACQPDFSSSPVERSPGVIRNAGSSSIDVSCPLMKLGGNGISGVLIYASTTTPFSCTPMARAAGWSLGWGTEKWASPGSNTVLEWTSRELPGFSNAFTSGLLYCRLPPGASINTVYWTN